MALMVNSKHSNRRTVRTLNNSTVLLDNSSSSSKQDTVMELRTSLMVMDSSNLSNKQVMVMASRRNHPQVPCGLGTGPVLSAKNTITQVEPPVVNALPRNLKVLQVLVELVIGIAPLAVTITTRPAALAVSVVHPRPKKLLKVSRQAIPD